MSQCPNRPRPPENRYPSRVRALELTAVNPELERILAFLNRDKIRATYKAVGEVLGIPAIAVNRRSLGEPRPERSWIVRSDTGLPTGYDPDKLHPNLCDDPAILKTGDALRRAMQRFEAKDA